MGLPKFRTKISVEDYLESEKFSPVRREYVDGEVFAIPQNNINHNRICRNISVALSNHLKDSKFEAFSHNIKTLIGQEFCYYPDILVADSEKPRNPYFRNEPVLIIEVTSKSTETIDYREKVIFYKNIPGIQEYVVVDQYRMEVRVHRRQANGGWITYYFTEISDIVEFTSVDLQIPLPEIYRRVTFDPNANRDEY